MNPPTPSVETATPEQREPTCVENWPDCYEGGYDPRCCRFPKTCSCTVIYQNAAPPTPRTKGEGTG